MRENCCKMRLLKGILLIAMLFAASWMQAQEQDGESRKKTRVHIEHYDKATYSQSLGDVQRLIGHVKIRHDSAYFFCDSAYFYEKTNSFDAYQNVHILVNDSVEIFSDLMNYDGNARFAEFFDNVRLMDDSTTLYTEYMTYDRNQHLACYPDSATTIRGNKTLISCIGYYRDDLKELSFFENVIVTHPKYQMYTDTLYYNTKIEKMWFLGPTTIVNEENILDGTRGHYLVKEDHVFLDKRPFLHNKTQQVHSDSIFYDRNRGVAKAYEHVDMIDTSYKMIMRGGYVELWEHKEFSYATDSAYAIYYEDGDSLYLHSDTMFFYFDKEKEELDRFIARRNVRFYKSDLQGKCDTLTYHRADSTVRMRVAPVLWNEESQMTADRIDIKTDGENVDFVFQDDNAFIASRDTIEGFNQIKGTDIISHFKKGEIHHVNVDGNSAESIYWIRDDDGGIIGIDVAKSETMVIEMKNNNISIIKSFRDIQETMYPEEDLNESSRYLSGFKWYEEVRPKDKDDIFRHIEVETPQVKSEETTPETPVETPAEEEPQKRHRARNNNKSISNQE